MAGNCCSSCHAFTADCLLQYFYDDIIPLSLLKGYHVVALPKDATNCDAQIKNKHVFTVTNRGLKRKIISKLNLLLFL